MCLCRVGRGYIGRDRLGKGENNFIENDMSRNDELFSERIIKYVPFEIKSIAKKSVLSGFRF